MLLNNPTTNEKVLIKLTGAENRVNLEDVGGKAFNLHKLYRHGMPVPFALAIPALVHAQKVTASTIQEWFAAHEETPRDRFFAVRSSGIGEDGENNSCAGIFESYLEVPFSEIGATVHKVWKSLETPRSKMYMQERGISIDSMGVVVQEMIDADYAGVAFSVCPVEKDPRVALLEVVAGTGESLVSGTKTPHSIRVNRRTGMMRVHQNGADEIHADTLKMCMELIVPLLEAIETHYAHPVDIEWAIKDGTAFILQARPITT